MQSNNIKSMDGPRVCQVMLAKGFGGAERLFVDLVIELHIAGVPVLPVCHPQGKSRELLEEAGIKCSCIRSLGWWDPIAPQRINRLARKFRADIIHTHLARATCLTARAGTGLPFIASLHNYGKSRYYRSADWFVPITRDGARHLEEIGINADRITVISNFSRVRAVIQAHTTRHHPPRLLAYGRFVEKKGFDDLLDALQILKQRGLEFSLLIGGDGPLYDHLRSRVDALGLSGEVEFTGWLEDVVNALDNSDLFILPSRSEPFGIVVLEAMARGVPIVTTRTQGPTEILSSETARFAAIGNPPELADTIEQGLLNVDDSHNKAEMALALYRQSYTSAVIIPKIIHLYKEMYPKD